MPTSRSERIVFFSGLAVIALLAALVLPAWKSYRDAAQEQPAASASAPVARVAGGRAVWQPKPKTRPAASNELVGMRFGKPEARGPDAGATKKPAAPAAPVTPTPSATKRKAPAKRVAPTAPSRAELRLTAARGDCWVEVRSQSASGKVLYVGILTKGQSKSFAAKKIWVRFGAPEVVDAKLSGKTARLPSGALNALFSPSGVTAA